MNDIHPAAKIHPSVLELLKNRIGVRIGADTEIEKNVRIANGVHIGSRCKIDEGCNFQDNALLSDDTIVGKNCFFAAFSCTADEPYPTVGKQVRKPVVVEDDCVIGVYGLLISCRIGKGAVLGTHSRATRDIPSNEVWEGRPAKFLYSRTEYDRKKAEWERFNAA